MVFAARLQPSEATALAVNAVSGGVAGCLSVTFEYCVETAKDTAIVAIECE